MVWYKFEKFAFDYLLVGKLEILNKIVENHFNVMPQGASLLWHWLYALVKSIVIMSI